MLCDMRCVGMHGSTCDEAHQLVVAFNPDTNMPIRFVAGGLQRPLQKVVCVLESALKHARLAQTVSSTSKAKQCRRSFYSAYLSCHAGVLLW